MTFAEPVESLNAVSTELRESEPQMPKPFKALVIRAADMLDDQERKIEDQLLELTMIRGFLVSWANELELSTQVKIGQMDSDSRAQEKQQEGAAKVWEVIRHMRDLK